MEDITEPVAAEEHADQAVQEQAAIPLDVPRVVTLKAKGGDFVYHTRRITDKDWQEHFRGIVNERERVDGVRHNIFDPMSALVQLTDAVTVRVEGYGDTSAVRNWRAALPLAHRMAVGSALRSAAPEDRPADARPALCETVEVRLSCAWQIDGATKAFSGLVHRFRQPGVEHLLRFNRTCADTQVSGDGDNTVTVFPARQLIAMKLYDELIESVDGYTVAGVALEGAEAIRREMDGAHKAAAALELFMGSDDGTVLG